MISSILYSYFPKEIPGTNGYLRFYPLFIFAGYLASILASWIKLKRRGIPTEPLEWAVCIIAPTSIIGASIIGKINSGTSFWGHFAFWDGGLSVHGGVIFGVFFGFLWFYFQSKKYEISLWVFADAIIPNIFLGQVIGRWGNFFNHEILGQEVLNESLNWMPQWFLENLRTENDSIGVIRQPLFLYESIMNLFAWIFITFIIPKLGMWVGPKPWKKYPNKFRPLLQKEYESLKNERALVKPFKKLYYKRIWKLNCWNQTYFEHNLAKNKINPTIVPKMRQFKLKSQSPLFRSMEKWIKTKWYQFLQKLGQNARPLEKSQNPDKYWMTRVGVQTGVYIVLFNAIRLILEHLRTNEEMFISKSFITSYILLSLGVILGIIWIIFAQVISVKKWRQEGWLYEKQY